MKFIIQKSEKRKFLCLVMLGFFSILQSVQLDLSYMSLEDIFSRGIESQLLACGSILLVTLFFMLFTMRLHIACLISGCVVFVLSIVNHYVFLFTSEPFSPVLFSSVQTGMKFLEKYRFSPDGFTLFSFFCLLAEIGISMGIKKVFPGKQRFERKRFLVYFTAFLFLFVSAACSNIFLYHKGEWIFNAKTYNHGYLTFFVQKTIRSGGTLVEAPPGYSKEKLEKAADEFTASPGKAETYPDIILILNETFYDLSVYAEFETDRPYLENYRALENAVKGYAISPYAMNGTNDSEFELLTGLSSLLFKQRAPFTTYSSFEKINSIARYLSALGYSTQANHPCDPLNYNRQKVYPALGFDTVRFYDDFAYHVQYGNRCEMDALNYREMIRWYEEAGEAPRFLYLLTYQNHGGYEQNDSILDTVHVKGDLGEATDQANEYLTSIQMSDKALKELLDYFDSVDRPVIVCMVGDHSPAFLSEIPESYGASETEKNLLSQEIPFFIWGNNKFGRIAEEENRLLGMTDLLPLVMETAGLPLSPYYNSLLALSRSVPVRTGDGYYQTVDGQAGELTPSDALFDEISLPLYIAYADLNDTSGIWDFLFSPP